jgi:hypothetical protein
MQVVVCGRSIRHMRRGKLHLRAPERVLLAVPARQPRRRHWHARHHDRWRPTAQHNFCAAAHGTLSANASPRFHVPNRAPACLK